MPAPHSIEIAGIEIPLHDADAILAELHTVYGAFQDRTAAFIADARNPHLCHAGCSHCCRKGAVFAVTLAEAVLLARTVDTIPSDLRDRCRRDARKLVAQQEEIFPQVPGPPDVPGQRDEAVFSARITRLNTLGPACPLLEADLCSVYEHRPLLCRAYGVPVDAYAVESGDTLVFRSLCHLYEGMQLRDYVRARDLKARLTDLSRRLTPGRDPGRFTSPEAILARLSPNE